MAYDSETYGQSPFGKSVKAEASGAKPGVDQRQVANNVEQSLDSQSTGQTGHESDVANRLPPPTNSRTSSRSKAAKPPAKVSTRKRKSTAKSAAKTTRQSKKAKAEAVKAEAEAAELTVARRFIEEDRRAYFSLLQKTGISGLVWAVLRLSRYELSDEAIAVVNILIHPLMISALALIATTGLTFWLRRLLNDLAQHTQQLQADAEAADGKGYRPTIEIVGDSLEYNPKLRKSFARLFDAASILICTLVSYLLVIGLTLAWQVK